MVRVRTNTDEKKPPVFQNPGYFKDEEGRVTGRIAFTLSIDFTLQRGCSSPHPPKKKREAVSECQALNRKLLLACLLVVMFYALRFSPSPSPQKSFADLTLGEG